MIQKQANSVKDLAKPVVEALEKMTEKKCTGCDGYGVIDGDTPGGDLGCGYCRSTGKERWEWKPKIGEWIITSKRTLLVCRKETDPDIKDLRCMDEWGLCWFNSKSIIPILPWETIEKVLEGVGYQIQLVRQYITWSTFNWYCEIRKVTETGYRLMVVGPVHKDRQQAVMKAVIKLGEEKHD